MLRSPSDAFLLDIPRLHSYLSSHLTCLSSTSPGNISVLQFTGGQSNPTYLLSFDNGFKCVLRTQPPGQLLASAHQVIREATILQFIHSTKIRVPQILLICEDESILDKPFFIMEYLDGVVHRSPSLPSVPSEHRSHIYESAVVFLAKLHAIPPNIPSNPSKSSSISTKSASIPTQSSFFRRQIAIWSEQHRKSALLYGDPCQDLQTLGLWLSNNIPYESGNSSSILHGDYRIDNIVYSHTNPSEIIGVLDWELSSNGDAATDLAYFLLPFYLPSSGLLSIYSVQSSYGIPSIQSLMSIYTANSSLSSLPSIDSSAWIFRLCIGLYRMACIASGVKARAIQHNAVSKQANSIALLIPALTSTALCLIKSIPKVNTTIFMSKNLVDRVHVFVSDVVIPYESTYTEHYVNSSGVWPDRGDKWRRHACTIALITEAKRRRLWNLWITSHLATSLQSEFPSWPWDSILPSPPLTHTQYMFIARISGKSLLAPLVLNCSAPDTGNMEILTMYGSSKQKEDWLLPLLLGESRSCFAMTESNVASSDPTQLNARGVRSANGDWVLSGRKWWTTGACDELCSLCIFVARTGDSSTSTHDQHSLFLVPMSSPGLTIIRPLHVLGYDDAPQGHAEILLSNAIVEEDSLLGKIGEGFALMQARLGPGRLHHCARLIGHGDRAIEHILSRGNTRQAFGKTLLSLGGNAEELAKCSVRVDRSFLLVMHAAALLDEYHEKSKYPRELIASLAAVKADVPKSMELCLDFAIQIHGGGGLSFDHPLAAMFAACRVLRIVDGPDEVHLGTISKMQGAEWGKSHARAKL